MLKIRKDNQFTWAWAITRKGEPVDLATAANLKFTYQIKDQSGRVSIATYTKTGNIISTVLLPTVPGIYNLQLTFDLPTDGPCAVDVDAFEIVKSSEEASEGSEFTVTSEMAVAVKGKSAYQVWLDAGNTGTVEDYLADIKGDPFIYDDLTPEQKAELKGEKGDPGAVEEAFEDGKIYGRKDGAWVEIVGASGEVDLSAYLKTVDANNSFQQKGEYLTSETDPTVPAWAKAESKPTYSIAEVSGLQTALDNKVDDSQVLTNVPANAKFTDTVYTHPATHSIAEIADLQTALNGKVDDSQVLTDVPANAKFTDTVYTHPDAHAISFITGLETALSGKADTSHAHDDRYYTESEVNALLAAKKGAYDAEIVTSPTTGTLTLKNSTETVLDGSLTSSNTFTVALPTPTAGQVNESILIFKIGASLPTITQPTGIIWRGATPTLAISTNWTIVYEQVNTTGTTYEIWAVATKNA